MFPQNFLKPYLTASVFFASGSMAIDPPPVPLLSSFFRSIRTWFPSLVCSPVGTDRAFSLCSVNLVFGCAADVVTLFLISFYSCRAARKGWGQKMKKCVGVLGLKRSLWIEILPAMAILLTLLQSFQLFFIGHETVGSPMHTWISLSLLSLAWVSSWWVLHYYYEVVMANYRILHFWWFLRAFFHIPFIYTMLKKAKFALEADINQHNDALKQLQEEFKAHESKSTCRIVVNNPLFAEVKSLIMVKEEPS